MDNDLISRSQACEMLLKQQQLTTSVVRRVLLQVPTVDAVEVVRCKDCAKDGLFTCPMCYIESHKLIFINHDPEFFRGGGDPQ